MSLGVHAFPISGTVYITSGRECSQNLTCKEYMYRSQMRRTRFSFILRLWRIPHLLLSEKVKPYAKKMHQKDIIQANLQKKINYQRYDYWVDPYCYSQLTILRHFRTKMKTYLMPKLIMVYIHSIILHLLWDMAIHAKVLKSGFIPYILCAVYCSLFFFTGHNKRLYRKHHNIPKLMYTDVQLQHCRQALSLQHKSSTKISLTE